VVVAYYIIGAGLAAWLTTGHGHLDWKLSILVLPLMFLAHFCHKAIARRHGSNRPATSSNLACLACMNEIGMFRRLAHHRFCCDEHESTYLAELEAFAIQRLHNARISASQGCQRVEFDNSYVATHEAVTPMLGHEQTLSLIVHPKVAGFGPSPAYRAAM
jgi:hypothetical protein